MYAGFDFIGNFKGILNYSDRTNYDSNKSNIRNSIAMLDIEKDILDADAIQKNWFPTIDADVFISHSHGDLTQALLFAKKLREKFGLKAFIDSCVWGFCEDLISNIEIQMGNIDYLGRIKNVTLHDNIRNAVNVLLMTALNKQIDNTECFIFMRSNNSVPMTNKTFSPWIFGELYTSLIIRKRTPQRLKNQVILEQKNFSNSGAKPSIAYPLYTDHLIKINNDIITKWETSCSFSSICGRNIIGSNCLNELYKIVSK